MSLSAFGIRLGPLPKKNGAKQDAGTSNRGASADAGQTTGAMGMINAVAGDMGQISDSATSEEILSLSVSSFPRGVIGT